MPYTQAPTLGQPHTLRRIVYMCSPPAPSDA